MALQKCPECGREISTKAGACPHCGNPGAGVAGSGQPAKPKKRRWLIKGLLIFVGFLFLMSAIGNCSKYQEKARTVKDGSSATQAKQQSAAEVAKQPERKKYIEELIEKGVFQKVEATGSLPHLWVEPTFYALDFETKQTFVSVVYAYYVTMDDQYTLVKLNDGRSGKEIGKYAPVYGGLKLY